LQKNGDQEAQVRDRVKKAAAGMGKIREEKIWGRLGKKAVAV